jgi:hypothetical protein
VLVHLSPEQVYGHHPNNQHKCHQKEEEQTLPGDRRLHSHSSVTVPKQFDRHQSRPRPGKQLPEIGWRRSSRTPNGLYRSAFLRTYVRFDHPVVAELAGLLGGLEPPCLSGDDAARLVSPLPRPIAFGQSQGDGAGRRHQASCSPADDRGPGAPTRE